ncbi:MAG TPA: dockerin type I domain-containing protein [Pirellulaceae bacterium]|jgi:hypothetical protein
MSRNRWLSRSSRTPVRCRRLIVETLETRTLLAATITVNSALDNDVRDAVLTLREAIEVSNRTLAIASLTNQEQAQVSGTPTANDADTIGFNIPGGGVRTIDLTVGLPDVTESVTIDGYTQPGASANTNGPSQAGNAVLSIELNGTNAGQGLTLVADDCLIRGLVINRSREIGIWVLGDRNRIEGNYVGTDPSGTVARPNIHYGILISGDFGNLADNIIGGASPEARNLISGNEAASGVYVVGVQHQHTVTNTTIQGNFIGTDVTGTVALPNASGIVLHDNATATHIGGSGVGEGNLISGNHYDGIGMGVNENQCGGFGTSIQLSDGDLVQGNRIGTDASGTHSLGNGLEGVSVGFPGNHAVGGTAANEGNIIAFNGCLGVGLLNGHTSVLGNSIFSNAKLGIDIGINGKVEANDTDDTDGGANNHQNFPELNAAVLSNGLAMTVSYRVPSSTTFSAYPLRVEFFKADSDGIEGQTYLGFDIYAAAEAGLTKATTFTPATAVSLGDKIVTTATDAAGNTSEFSAGVVVGCSTIVVNTADSGAGSLRDAIICANTTPNIDHDGDNTVDADAITFAIPGSGVHTISQLSALPTITDPVIIDGYTQPGSGANTLVTGDNAVLLIELNGTNVSWPYSGLDIFAGNSTVRGLVINRFKGDGILLQTFGGDTFGGNVVEGNFIGTDPSGTVAAGNSVFGGGAGVEIFSSSGNRIGGTTPEARNLISANQHIGVEIHDAFSASQNVVQGNFIGTDASGAPMLGNGDAGVSIVGDFAEASGNLVGGIVPGVGNIIAGNLSGVVIIGQMATANAVLGNSIFANYGASGLYLSGAPNDAADADTGPNNLQNYPEISYATTDDGKLKVNYNVPSDPANSTYPMRVEFFLADANGQGKTYLGFDTFTEADFAAGGKTVTLATASPIKVSDKIVATATDSLTAAADIGPANTSEFSAQAIVASPWQNHNPGRLRWDVNDDMHVVADDVLTIVNYINAKGSGKVPDSAENASPFLDVDGDNSVVAADVLDVINYINAGKRLGGEAEATDSEASGQSPTADDVMAILAADVAAQAARKRRA